MRLVEGMWPNNFAALCFLPSANSSRRAANLPSFHACLINNSPC